MIIHIIRKRATEKQVHEMAEEYQSLIKLAVDVERGILAGGEEWQADCGEALLKDGSLQENVWGADWFPESRTVGFDSLIYIRPSQGNFRTELQDPNMQLLIEKIFRKELENPA